MSRALEIIRRFVADTGNKHSNVEFIRINLGPYQGGSHSTFLEIRFSKNTIDDVLYNCLTAIGVFTEDSFFLKRTEASEWSKIALHEINRSESIAFLKIHLVREKSHLTIDTIQKTLRSSTVFGLPKALVAGLPVSKLKLHYGVNSEALDLFSDFSSNVSINVFENHGFIHDKISTPHVEFFYINDHGNLVNKKISIQNYLSPSTQIDLERHAYSPKVGLRIFSLFPSSFFNEIFPMQSWRWLKEQVQTIVQEDLIRHTRDQVKRISERISALGSRKKIIRMGIELGCVPQNEVETVLLFQKISLSYPQLLPQGLSVRLLDYSPKDIDSICEVQLTKDHPPLVVPVEFEFSLKSFFSHGHDYRQVELIICYTQKPLNFPYSIGGITYELDKTISLPRLINTADKSYTHCLILEDMFK